jgi:RimJ/RimL family protein N-acetyltransferase
VVLPSSVALRDGGTALLRRATQEDAEAHLANFNAIAAEGVFLMSEALTRSIEEVRRQFREADPRAELWLVAEVDGRVVGGANFQRGRWAKNAHTADLGMGLIPEMRGRGIGEAMLREGIEWARSIGIRKLKLGVFASNERAIGLYRKMGFGEEARLTGEVVLDGRPTDELLMALWL